MASRFASRPHLALFAALALVMLVTRTYSLSAVAHLPDTTLASFFVAGFFLRGRAAFFGLCALAGAIDLGMVLSGAAADCFSLAYPALLPAYALPFLAGRIAGRAPHVTLARAPELALWLVASASASEIVSTGSFYALSGAYGAPSWSGLAGVIAASQPRTLVAAALWSAAGFLAVGALAARRGEGVKSRSSAL